MNKIVCHLHKSAMNDKELTKQIKMEKYTDILQENIVI